MRKGKGFLSVILVVSMLVSVSGGVYASQEGGFSAGEMEQDNSGVMEPGTEESTESSEGSEGTAGSGATGTEEKQETKSYLDIKTDEMNDAQRQKEILESGLSDVKEIKKELEMSKYNLNQYVMELDSNLAEIETKISDLQNLIETKKNDIKIAEEELKKAKKAEEEQYASMKERIKFMYEKGDSTFIEMIFGSSSLADMLNKANYIQRLSEYDRKKMVEYQETIAYVEECEAQLTTEKLMLEEAATTAKAEQDVVEELIVEKQVEIEKYEKDISNKEELIKEYEADIAMQNNTIASLEAAVAAEKKRLAEAGKSSGLSYNGGTFAWPAPEYTRISSPYGMRMHPTLNVEKFHNGIDMAAPNGSPILAAYDGSVVAADYNSSMGNYIMIDHGDGLYTIYMHCSALYVSAGTKVTKGQNIAAVGSTGRSTGPHLHFSVRLNGNYVDPMNYL